MIKELLEKYFDITVEKFEKLGSGYDSDAYLVNDLYVFKIKRSANQKKGFKKEKAIYDFLNKHLRTNIKIPNVEFYYVSDYISILGYEKINGKFLTKELYSSMSDEEKYKLKRDIAIFLRSMHDLNYDEISEYKIDNKENVLEEYELLKETIYDELNDIEKNYVENFMSRLRTTKIFNGKKCLSHNDFSANHILINENNRFCGVIDFGDAGIIDEYCDFIYLLEDSDEEIGRDFGMDILNMYGDIDINKAIEYHDIVEQYYPIETIIYGIKNKRNDFIDKGRKIIAYRNRIIR